MASLRVGNRSYHLPLNAVAQSEVISSAVESGSDDVNLPAWIDHHTMSCIEDYLNFHSDAPSRIIHLPLASKRVGDNMCHWDTLWVRRLKSRRRIAAMINAADFLGIDAIIDICLCYYAAKYRR